MPWYQNMDTPSWHQANRGGPGWWHPVRRSVDLQSAVKKCPNLFGLCGFVIRNIQFVLFDAWRE